MEQQSVIQELKWKKFPVLDQGFICLVDVMGDDTAIVQAARVSYGDGTRTVSDNRNLIRYLMRHRHTSPFEMAELKFLVRVPMDIWRQWIRHRTASVNEYSTRYSVAIDAAHCTPPDKWRRQSNKNKQGSNGYLDQKIGKELSRDEKELLDYARRSYLHRVSLGVAREQARKDLPLSTYTEAYWKINLHNLLHFLELRMHETAQLEIREYANIIGYEIVAKLFPLTWEAFLDYRINSVTITRLDMEIIKRLIEQHHLPVTEKEFLAVQHKEWEGKANCRERMECLAKLSRLGLIIPQQKSDNDSNSHIGEDYARQQST